MIYNKLPKEFRVKVKRYLDYLTEYKKQYKLEEEDVIVMLSESLKLQLIIHLNGRMLHSTTIFKHYDVVFLSELTFLLKKEIFSVDDQIFRVWIVLYHLLGGRWGISSILCDKRECDHPA